MQPERARYVVHMQDTMEKFAAASPDKVFQADSDDGIIRKEDHTLESSYSEWDPIFQRHEAVTDTAMEFSSIPPMSSFHFQDLPS